MDYVRAAQSVRSIATEAVTSISEQREKLRVATAYYRDWWIRVTTALGSPGLSPAVSNAFHRLLHKCEEYDVRMAEIISKGSFTETIIA